MFGFTVIIVMYLVYTVWIIIFLLHMYVFKCLPLLLLWCKQLNYLIVEGSYKLIFLFSPYFVHSMSENRNMSINYLHFPITYESQASFPSIMHTHCTTSHLIHFITGNPCQSDLCGKQHTFILIMYTKTWDILTQVH